LLLAIDDESLTVRPEICSLNLNLTAKGTPFRLMRFAGINHVIRGG
jgi:hypothetical protein